MSALVSIGEFSRLSHLSVKALRHYHNMGVLTPADVDRRNGYRQYNVGQLPAAHMIRRLRDLDMPLPEVKLVLDSATDDLRDRAIAAHLDRMEHELDRTREVVASLRDLLATTVGPLDVEHRTLQAGQGAVLRSTVATADIETWCVETFANLGAEVASSRLTPSGPTGVQFSEKYFEQGVGGVVAFVPINDPVDAATGTVEILALPGGPHATTIHRGPYQDLDLTYGALGSHVAEHLIGARGPITEFYLVGPEEAESAADLRTEVCWPILA